MERKKRKKTTENNKSVLFLNLPIKDTSEDAIGLAAYADSISNALDKGAQTIAVTSSFGMGKTSVIELLRERRQQKKHESIIKVPMWTKLADCSCNGDTINMHRNFVYQIARQINQRRGAYVIRRLSSNYRLLKVHTNRTVNWTLIIISIVCFLSSFLCNSSNELISKIPIITKYGKTISNWAAIIGLISFAISITKSEIVFSNGKDEKRVIEADDIIDLYYNEILQHQCRPMLFLRKMFLNRDYNKHYIVIVEDLDRSNDCESVKSFLKEIRKYYVPSFQNSDPKTRFKNKLTIIINIKPESILDNKDNTATKDDTPEPDSLYDKVFDYTINIPTINIDDYETILESLLQKQKENLYSLGLSEKNSTISLPGIQWLIREPKVGLREIKNRLNRAILLYLSLKERFPKGNITFERCAVVAFLTTAYETDFYNTKDDAYQKIVDWGLKNKFDFNRSDNPCKEILKGCDDHYIDEVSNLVKVGLIDGGYRAYFYNYPKKSKIYSIEENEIQGILLYNREATNLDNAVKVVEEAGSSIIDASLSRIKQLGLFLPEVVFQSARLYEAVIKRSFDWAVGWMKQRDTSVVATEKTISQILQVLHFDSRRLSYNSFHAQEFVNLWEKMFTESQLMNLRFQICKAFPDEILWYKRLFFGHHSIVRKEELDTIPLSVGIELIDINNHEFTTDYIQYTTERYSNTENTESLRRAVTGFFESAIEILDPKLLAPVLVKFMSIGGIIDSKLEALVISVIQSSVESKKENVELINAYNNLVSEVAINGLSDQSINMICYLESFDEYNSAVAEELVKKGFIFESAMINLSLGNGIDTTRTDICSVIKSKKDWLISHESYLLLLRKEISGKAKSVIKQYDFLFDVDCPVVSKDEFSAITSNKAFDIDLIMSVIPPSLVSEVEVKLLVDYFSSEYRSNGVAFSILMFVSSFEPAISRLCFEDLNFDNLRYYSFSSQKQQTIKDNFFSILDLDEPERKIWFMKKTKRLDSEFEREIKEYIVDDEHLCNEYIEAVWCSSEKSITFTTIDLLCSINPVRALPRYVNDLLFKYKKYRLYVISTTLAFRSFIVETGERGQILWPVYIKMFKDNSEEIITDYMGQNQSFVQSIMNDSDFSGMSHYSRMKLALVYQTSASLYDIVENYDEEFALDYLTQIAGFADEEAAIDFLMIVNGKDSFIKSEALYNHTYDMLISPVLKANYTKIRKKARGK